MASRLVYAGPMTARVALAFLVFALALEVQAAPVTWAVSGVIRQVDVHGPEGGDPGPLAAALGSLGAVVDAELRASFVFETSAPDVDPNPQRGDYRELVGILDVSVGTWRLGFDSATGPSAGSQFVIARHPSLDPPLFIQIVSVDLLDPTGPFDRNAIFGADLYGLDSTVFPTDDLAARPPPVARLVPYIPNGTDPAFAFGTLGLVSGCGALGCASLYAEITSIERVPEPLMPILLGLGSLAGLFERLRSTRL